MLYTKEQLLKKRKKLNVRNEYMFPYFNHHKNCAAALTSAISTLLTFHLRPTPTSRKIVRLRQYHYHYHHLPNPLCYRLQPSRKKVNHAPTQNMPRQELSLQMQVAYLVQVNKQVAEPH